MVQLDNITTAFSNQSSTITINHTPVGTPKGVLILVTQGQAADNDITNVTYGGVAVNPVSASPVLATGEASALMAYFLGTGIPTGAQDAVLTMGGLPSRARNVSVVTLTAAADTAINNAAELVNAVAVASPVNATLTLGGIQSFVLQIFAEGRDVPTGVAPLAGWTNQTTADLGVQAGGLFTYDTVGTADVTCGYTEGASFDSILMGIAVKETAAADNTPDAFSFTAQTDVALSTQIVSNSQTITGMDAGTTISVTGGEYSIDAGTYTAAAGTINPGQAVTVRQTSSASNSTLTTATLTVGTVSADFDVTTAAPGATITVTTSTVSFGDTISFTTSSLGTITSRTVSDGTNTINLSGTDTTAVLPSLADGVSMILGEGTVTFEVSDGTNTVNDTITLNPPTNYSRVALVSGFDTSVNSWVYQWGGTPVVGVEAYYVTSEITLLSDGDWSTVGPGASTFYVVEPSTGFMQSADLLTANILLHVGSQQVVDVRYCSATDILSNVQLEIDGSAVWP